MPQTKLASASGPTPVPRTSKKRALAEITNTPAKRIRLSDDELELLGKDDLISRINELEDELENVAASKAVKSPAASAPVANGAVPLISDEDLKIMVNRARVLMVKGITSQMKWKPSCKLGSAKFSYSGALPSTSVFNALTLQDPHGKKNKKMLSLSPEEFAEKIARTEIEASARYNYLRITSKAVTMRWKEEDLTFTVSGSYGK